MKCGLFSLFFVFLLSLVFISFVFAVPASTAPVSETATGSVSPTAESIDVPATGSSEDSSPVSAESSLVSTSGNPLSARDLGLNIEHPYFTVPYSVNPSFSVDIPYDFSVYDEIPNLLRGLERCRDDISCIEGNITLIEGTDPTFNWVVSYGGNIISKDSSGELEYPAWEAYCETPEVHAVNSLAEVIDTCARSQSNDCVCSYLLPIVTPEDINRWYGLGLSYGLAVVPVIGPILGIGSFIATMLSDNLEWEERIFQFQRTQQGTRISMQVPPGANAQIVPRARFKSVEGALRGDNVFSLRYVPADKDEVIDVYKDSRGNISLYLQGDAPSQEICSLHNKLVKFCVIQNQTFLAYNQQDNRMGMQQLVLKFAYLFSSEVTDVRNFEIRDAKFSSNKSLLVWDPVAGVDADHYTVYYSENPAMSANLRTTSPSGLPDDVRADLTTIELFAGSKQDISIEISSIDNPSCNVFGTQCSLGYRLHTAIGDEMSDAQLQDNTLFYSTVDESFFYFLPNIRNNYGYFFGITVTDVNGQESPSFNMPLDAMHEDSVDDLPPGLATIRSVELNPGTNDVEFTIAPINYNIDGTSLDPVQVTNFKIYCAPQEFSGEFNISDHEPLFAQSISTNSDGSVSFKRPTSDFTDIACGITSSPRAAKVIVVGVKRIGATDYDFRGIVDSQSFTQTVILPES